MPWAAALVACDQCIQRPNTVHIKWRSPGDRYPRIRVRQAADTSAELGQGALNDVAWWIDGRQAVTPRGVPTLCERNRDACQADRVYGVFCFACFTAMGKGGEEEWLEKKRRRRRAL